MPARNPVSLQPAHSSAAHKIHIGAAVVDNFSARRIVVVEVAGHTAFAAVGRPLGNNPALRLEVVPSVVSAQDNGRDGSSGGVLRRDWTPGVVTRKVQRRPLPQAKAVYVGPKL
jgi:hypothetical protein